jgi:hypothetical protein
MKLNILNKIKSLLLVALAFSISNNAISQCESGKYPGLNNVCNNGWSPDYIHGSLFSGLAGGTLTGIGYKGLGTGGTRKLMVYTNVSGTPGTLVAYTNAFTVGTGQIVVPVVTVTVIPAGNYWIMSNEPSVADQGFTSGSVTSAYYYSSLGYAFGSIPPNTTSWTNLPDSQEDFYLDYNCTASALNFDGGNDHVAVFVTGLPINNSQYTIEAKIKPTILSVEGIVGWGNYGTGGQANALRLDGSGNIINYWWGPDLSVSCAPINLLDGNWHHVAAAFDGTTRRIFVDGILKGSDTPGATHSVPNMNFKIGSTNNGEYFNGGIDEVRIWNVGRTQCDINTYKDCEIPTTATGLIANYHFNQGINAAVNTTVTTLVDVSGNSNTGTLTNFALTGTTSNWISPGGVISGYVTPLSNVSGTTVVTNIACFGGSTGAINLTPAGGTGPYTFNWLPSGPTTEDRTGLIAGTYSVQITDANGCTGTVNATVTQPASNVSGTTVVTNIACFGGSNGAINLTPSGGTPGYTFNWLPSGPTTEDRTGLTAGTYTVQITDANGCAKNVNITVTQPSSNLSGTTVVTNVSCFGGSNGAINLTPTGGTPGYTFNWLPSGPTTEDRTGLTVGTYSVQITDANGCTGTVNATVTQPASNVSGTTVVTNIACFGGSTGAINLTPAGGTSPYTFNWLPSGPTTEDRTGLTAGTYSVQITDINGCTGNVNATVTQPASNVSGTTVVTNIACFGGSNGAINLTPSGGTPGYTFNWLPSGPTTEDRTGLTAGTYTVQITDANGCAKNVNITVTQPSSNLSGTTVLTNVSCFGGSNGAINLTPSGGTGPYTFNWLPSGPTTEDRTGLTAGTYSVQITDANGCTANVNATVTQPSSNVAGTTVVTNISCFGGSNGAINLTPSGGTGPYTFNWLPSGPTTEDRTGLIAGTYSVQITDINGCTGTVNATVTQPTAISITIASQSNISCFGGSNGGAAVNAATGGAGSFTYNWNPGTPTGDGTTSITGLTAGTYSCTVTDANGCTANSSVFTITQPTAISITQASQTNVSCFGGSNGAATVNAATGGTGSFSYNWNPGTPTGDGTTSITGLTAGNYSCTVTDANGCTANSLAFTITAPTSIAATTTQTNVICFGTSTGIASVNASGGTGSFSYLWSPTGGTAATANGLSAGNYTNTITDANGCTLDKVFILTENAAITSTVSSTNCSSYTLNGSTYTSSGTYTQLLSGASSMGCDSTITLNLTIIQPTSSTLNQVVCNSYILNGNTYTSSGTYVQMLTNTVGCDSTITLNLTINQPTSSSLTEVACVSYNLNGTTYTSSGTYTQMLTNTAGCDSTLTLNLTINQPTSSTLTEVACASYILNGTTYTSSGTYTQMLTNIAGCDSTLTLNLTINQPTSSTLTEVACASYILNGTTYISSGTYTQMLTNTAGCDSILTLNLTVNALPILMATTNNTLLCTGQTATLSVTGAISYSWSTSETTPDIAVTPTIQTTYTVDGTDANGCSNTATITQDVSLCTGIATLSNNTNSINAYPNPNNGLFVIDLTTTSQVTVTNALGQVVLTEVMVEGKHSVDIHNEATGIYFVKVVLDGKQQVIKLIKE